MSSEPEVIEVDATVIETDIASPLAGAERWLAEKRAEVEAEATSYAAFEVVDTNTYKQAKKDRGVINKKVKAINAERIDKVKAITAAVDKLKADVDGITEPLTEVAKQLDAQCKQWEADVIARRKAMLVETYEEAAPDIAGGLVPFDAIVKRFGMGQLGAKWLLYGTNDEAARKQLMESLTKIKSGEQTIDSMVSEEDRDTVKGLYFSTLDMEAALAKARELSEQRERMRELDAKRKQREEEQARMEAELAKREAERAAAEQAAQNEAQRARESDAHAAEVRAAREQAEANYAAGYRTGVLDMPGNNGSGKVSRADMNAIDMVKNGAVTPTPTPAPQPSEQPRMSEVSRQVLNGMAGKQHVTLVFAEPVSELVLDVSTEELELFRRILRYNHVKGVIRGLRRQ